MPILWNGNIMLELKWVDYKTAKYSVLNWHYSKSMPVGKMNYIGVWENNKFIGCVVYGQGACPYYHKRFNISNLEICELLRVALDKHEIQTSKIISISLKMVKKKNNKLKCIISFADSNQGHIGILYQASNFYYLGISKEKYSYIYKGKKYHDRNITNDGIIKTFNGYKLFPKKSECKKVLEYGKYRYIYLYDNNIKDKIKNIIKPYPKKICVENIDSDVNSIPAIKEGASPISTLHI